MQSRKSVGRIGRFLRNYKILQILSQHFILPKKPQACSQIILPFTLESNPCPWVPNVIFSERLNGKFSKTAVEFNSSGSLANPTNPTNFRGNLPDSRFHQVPQIVSQNPSLKNLQKFAPKKSYHLS